MSDTPSRRFFIPPWLDDLDIKPHPFRVLCHLLRRAGEDGRCYPSGESIAFACRIHIDTLWPALKTLEKAGFITRLPKRFGGSNAYVIHLPTSGKPGVIDKTSIDGKAGAIESLQSEENPGHHSAEIPGCQSAEKAGHKESPPKKPNRRNPKPEVSPEAVQFAQWYKSTLPETVNLKPSWQQSFAEIFDDLIRLDNRTPEQIREVCRWARYDSFWSSNFMSPAKLRKRNDDGVTYFDVFAQKMKQPASYPSKPTTTQAVNTGRRTSNIEEL
jgi:hypothetical protein